MLRVMFCGYGYGAPYGFLSANWKKYMYFLYIALYLSFIFIISQMEGTMYFSFLVMIIFMEEMSIEDEY